MVTWSKSFPRRRVGTRKKLPTLHDFQIRKSFGVQTFRFGNTFYWFPRACVTAIKLRGRVGKVFAHHELPIMVGKLPTLHEWFSGILNIYQFHFYGIKLIKIK